MYKASHGIGASPLAVFSFDSFSASLLCLFEVSLVANWWVVADAAERAHGPVIGRGFFYVYKTVVWLVYLPIFMGFMITAFSKVHVQMKEELDAYKDFYNQLPRGFFKEAA